MNFFGIHNHTEMSNLRLLDSIIKPEKLITRAKELGFSGICVTDHESLCNHIEINKLAQLEDNKNFKIGLGNEIYLCEDRRFNQKYYHFILLAKNKQGHKALRELSSRAWLNSYIDRGMERVVTTFSDLEEIIKRYPNSLIGTSACLGGLISSCILDMSTAELIGDETGRKENHQKIVSFVLWCKELFGDDFYIECAPACSEEQIIANKRLLKIAECFSLKMVVGADAHYLNKDDRYVHSAFLTSNPGEREVDKFYEYAYLQSKEEMIENLKQSYDIIDIMRMFENTMGIYDKIENYSLLHSQQIPHVPVKKYPKKCFLEFQKYPNLDRMSKSEDDVERYWVNQCWEALERLAKKKPINMETYLEELEEEADVKRIVGEKLDTNMFSYPVVLQHYIDLIWACGSTIAPGRGSACAALNHFLLGITQADPIEWKFPFFRYMNRDTVELGDIDIDVSPSRRPYILQEIKKERGQNFKKDIDELSRANLGCTMIATFSTTTTKAAILSSCRGYRSEEYPLGIDVDEAQYLASLVPQDRGFVRTFEEIMYGDEEKGYKPVKSFINEIKKYPRLDEIISGISGLVKGRSCHASGVIMFDKDPYEYSCFMRTKEGEVVTQYDLHSAEQAGCTKFDILVTAIQDKLTQAIELLQEDKVIEPELSLKEAYDKYLHPDVLPLNDPDTWNTIQGAKSLDLFQLDSDIGRQGAKKVRPTNMQELSAVNALIRLMTNEKGVETPMEKYIRFRRNPILWEKEMDMYGLTEENKDAIKPYLIETFGLGISQEQLMRVLLDPNICGFTLAEANQARRIISKKKMNKIPELRAQIEDKAVSLPFGRYVWDAVVKTQLGYSFSEIHSISYSLIGYQTAYIATHWNSTYWNTACLIVNSGSLEDETIKEKNKDYSKMAKAVNTVIKEGIKLSLVDINNSQYSFKPDVKNNRIFFGMRALSGLNREIINKIIELRPYSGIKDFMQRCKLSKPAMISLIKGGAFDEVEKERAEGLSIHPRVFTMIYYLMNNCEAKTSLNLQNMNGLIQNNLIPEEYDKQRKVYNFNKYLKSFKEDIYYRLDDRAQIFIKDNYNLDEYLILTNNGDILLPQKKWDKIYKEEMDIIRAWLKNSQAEILERYNTLLFKTVWDKSAAGTISKWEMEALCFYYHEHELSHINKDFYGITNFFNLSPDSEIQKMITRGNTAIPIYKIYKIAGTVIGKNDTRASISLLTTEGVVNVKFSKEYYSMFKRQISVRNNFTGKKEIIEKSWFKRGTMLMVQGYRRDDTFVGKTYSATAGHQLYKIDSVIGDKINLVHERAQGEAEDEYEE